MVTVPSIQGTMLHCLANHYNVEWSKKVLLEFLATLGTGFGIQYFSKLGIRQLVKFIPVYGQTVGAATAATISFSSTLAIGRAACKYLHHKSTGGEIPEEEIRAMYQSVFKTSKEVANYESPQK